MTKSIFISHAVNDEQVAKAFMTLLDTGTSITSEDVFCSSIPGQGIPAGKDFITWIQKELKHTKAVVSIITPNYLDSHFCLCELGAAWVTPRIKMFPMRIAAVETKTLKGILPQKQLKTLENAAELTGIVSELCKILGKDFNAELWQGKLEEQHGTLKGKILTIPAPTSITYEEHKKTLKKLEECKNREATLSHKIKELEIFNNELKSCNTEKEKATVIANHQNDLEEYLSLVEDIKSNLSVFSDGVVKCIFNDWRYGKCNLTDDELYKYSDSINEAVDENILIQDDDGHLCLNDENDDIDDVRKSLRSLSEFIDNASSEFYETIKKKYGKQIDLNSYSFWKRHFS
jgi:hypothetical protein